MQIYWILFLTPLFLILSPLDFSKNMKNLGWIATGIIFVAVIGSRYQVGADWQGYLNMYDLVKDEKFEDVALLVDPGYAALNLLSIKLDGGILFVNIMCASVVMVGLLVYCRKQPIPPLALLIAVPYLLIVVSIGYSRQGVAIGCEMLALSAVSSGSPFLFFLYIIVGGLFHKTALFLLFLMPFVFWGHRPILSTIPIAFAIFAWLALPASLTTNLFRLSVGVDMVSEGGFTRVALNAVPASILLLFRNKIHLNECVREQRVQIVFAILSLACIPLVNIASTAVDRTALYFFPLQIFVFTRVHRIFSHAEFKSTAVLSVIFAYGMIQVIWLNFSTHAFAWIPYQSILFN